MDRQNHGSQRNSAFAFVFIVRSDQPQLFDNEQAIVLEVRNCSHNNALCFTGFVIGNGKENALRIFPLHAYRVGRFVLLWLLDARQGFRRLERVDCGVTNHLGVGEGVQDLEHFEIQIPEGHSSQFEHQPEPARGNVQSYHTQAQQQMAIQARPVLFRLLSTSSGVLAMPSIHHYR